MARNTKVVSFVGDETAGRDKDKTYLLTEWPAAVGEKWAVRVLRALVRANVDLPSGLTEEGGWAALALVSVKALAGMEWDEGEALLDEMMTCVKIIRDAAHPDETTFPLLENDVEEISTRLRLRVEVFNLHSRPSLPGVLSMLPPGTGSRVSPEAQTSP